MTANLNTIIIRYVHDNYSIHRLFMFKLLLEKNIPYKKFSQFVELKFKCKFIS